MNPPQLCPVENNNNNNNIEDGQGHSEPQRGEGHSNVTHEGNTDVAHENNAVLNENGGSFARHYELLLPKCSEMVAELKKLRVCGAREERRHHDEMRAAENEVLKAELAKLQEERTGLKYIVSQQNSQLERQSREYVITEQIIAEQEYKIKQLVANSIKKEKKLKKKIEKMGKEFAARLAKLTEFPKRFECEKRKFEQCFKENGELQQKLNSLDEELKDVKEKIAEMKVKNSNLEETSKKDGSKHLKRVCQTEEVEKHQLIKELQLVKDELNTVQMETSESIALGKRNAKILKSKMKRRISELKDELAYKQRETSVVVARYNKQIIDLQSRLQDVTHKFQAAQNEINTLKTEITCLNGEVVYQFSCGDHGIMNME